MVEKIPTTALIERVLSRAAEVMIVETSPHELDRSDAARIVLRGEEITDLARPLAIVDGGTGSRCRCLGWPTILVLDAAGTQIACWTLHHQEALGGIGNCDADLRDGPSLTRWLADRGLTGSLEVQRMLAQHDADQELRRKSWVNAAPEGLRAAAESVSQSSGRDAETQLAELVVRHYPHAMVRVRVLLEWAGVSERHGDGNWWYELAPQRMLLMESTESIFQALLVAPATALGLDGAAQLFTALEWTESRSAEIPEPLLQAH